MLAKLHTYSLLGIEALPVEVEVDVSAAGLPKTILVGLPEAAVKESIHRIDRALVNSGFVRPNDRVVVNLAPADLPKNASSFDLPIALGSLVGSGQMTSELLEQYAVVGELALDGSTRSVKGALSMAMAAAKHKGIRGILVPSENAQEAAVVENIEVIAISSLTQAVAFFTGNIDIEPTPSNLEQWFETYSSYDVDYADVRGQEFAKRAIVIAASANHNLLMLGPPGSGKSMLANRMPTILPQLTAEESIETTRIYSALGLLKLGQPLLARRPFRAPHHTISNIGLVGGGTIPTPGEISLSHNGVLFLDELPEFDRRTLEVLRQPLEEGNVTISRALNSSTFPCNFMLIAALNPCPCGYRTDPRRDCNCTPPQIERYMNKISGPLLDRIDIHIEVPAVAYQDLTKKVTGTSSQQMREQVMTARETQAVRFRDSKANYNAQMTSREIRQHCQLNAKCQSILEASMNDFGLSARAHDKILRIARTIADLESSADITKSHISEAVNYRTLDRQMWS